MAIDHRCLNIADSLKLAGMSQSIVVNLFLIISDLILILQIIRLLSWKQNSLQFVTFLTEVLVNMELGFEITKTANF